MFLDNGIGSHDTKLFAVCDEQIHDDDVIDHDTTEENQ